MQTEPTRRNILALPLAAMLPGLPEHPGHSPTVIDGELARAVADWQVKAVREEHGPGWYVTFTENGSTNRVGFGVGLTLHYAMGKRGPIRRAWAEFHRQHAGRIVAQGWSKCRRCWMVFTKG